MREILFRGKSVDNGEWVYGTGISKIVINCRETNGYNIVNNCDYGELDNYIEVLYDTEKVIPKTIGQYTGLKDKNGKMIFEGDIIEYKDSTGLHHETVVFDKGCFYAGFHGGSSTRVAPKLINTRISKVVGNMYEVEE